MQKLCLYFIAIISLVNANLKVNAQDILDSVQPKPAVVSLELQQKIATWQLDSSIYTQRLDSLNSPVNLVYNTQVQKYIKTYTSFRKNEISVMLEKSKYYFPIFEKALKAYNVPDVFKFLPVIESEMDGHAISKSGATGLWQFMYGTARNYSLIINDYVDERKDPIQASYAAAKYLRDAYNELGDWFLALAAYNCGSGAVKRAIIKAGGEKNIWHLQPYLSNQTQKYIPAFIAATYVMSYPNCHQILPTNLKVTTLVDSIYVNCHINLSKFCGALNLSLTEIKHLNPSYIKGIVNGSNQTPKRLVLPQLNKVMYASLYNQLHKTLEPDKDTILPTATPQARDILIAKTKNAIITNEDEKTIAQKQVNTPTASYTNYTVKAGDTLMAIAQQFKGLTVHKIKEINQIVGTELVIGSVLKLVEISN